MNRFATRLRRRRQPSAALRRTLRHARQPSACQPRRLLLETLEDRRLLTGATELTNVVPPAQTTQSETPLAFTSFRGNAFSVISEEPTVRQIEATFTTTHGQLSLLEVDSINGPIFDQGDGTNDSTFTLRGTTDNINLALKWLVFQPDPQFSGTASITLQTTDFAPLSELESESDIDTVSISVLPADNWEDSPSWTTFPGMLDNRFHDNGKLTQSDLHINRVALTDENQMLAVGEMDQQLALARLHPDGTLDTTFGNDGTITTDLTGDSSAEDLIIQPDGKIVVVGAGATETTDSQLVVARFNADGSADTTFGTNGTFTLDWDTNASSERAYAAGFHANGKIVVAGSGSDSRDIIVIQLNSNGQLDTDFDGDGKVSINLDGDAVATDLVVSDDGSMLLGAAVLDESFVLLRLDYGGHLANTFIADMGEREAVNDMLVYPDGKILLAGQANDHFSLARFQSDGSLDTSFGTLGKVHTPVGSSSSQIHRVILQPDGKLIAVGQTDSGDGQNFSVVRYERDGTLDTSFDDDGIRSIAIGGDDVARDILILNDGSLLILGGTGGTTTDMVQLVGDTRPGEIHGKLFHDRNGNGRQESGEPGLAGWTVFIDANHNNQLDNGEVSLLTAADDPGTTNVDETGTYQFTELAPGRYSVIQVIPQDWASTTQQREAKSESFDHESSAAENGWASNNPVPEIQTIGFSTTDHAGGSAGEARAFWKRHESPSASYYADTNLLRTVTFDDHFTGSGTLEVQNPTGSLGDGAYLGFFNSAQDGPGGESQNVTVAGFSFDENNWSLSLWQTLLGYQSGLQRLDSPTTAITGNTDLAFSFSYDPAGGDHGRGLLSGSLGGQQQQIHLTSENRAALQGRSLDAFGLYRPAVNDGDYNQPGIDLYVDDLDYQSYVTIEVRASEVKEDVDLGNQNPNQGPQLHLPIPQVATEDTDLVIQGLSVSDPDAGDEPVRIMLSVLHGSMTLSQTTGLEFQTGDGVADSLITMTGSLAMINAALNGMNYRGQQDYFGADFLASYINDLGNTGDGVPLSDSQTLPITVTNLNDPPVAVDDEYLVDENHQLNVVAPGVMVNDHDVDNDALQVITISEPGHGSLVLNSNGSLLYIPDLNFNQTDSFTYQLNDGNDVSNVATVKVNVKTQFVWHNSVNPYDVNGDGAITPQDVLHIINTLNQLGSRELSMDRALPLIPPFYDVNRDGFVSPSDVLMIINRLNEEAQAEEGDGEGEETGEEMSGPQGTVANNPEILLASQQIQQDLPAGQLLRRQLPDGLSSVILNPTADNMSYWQRVDDALTSFTRAHALLNKLSDDDEKEVFDQLDWLEPLGGQLLDQLVDPSH